MKRNLFLTLLFVALAPAAFGQIEAGTISIGGTLGYTSSTVEDFDGIGGKVETTSDAFTIAPRAGYFIAENFEIGLGIGYTTATLEATGSEEQELSTFSGTVFGNYYLFSGDKFAFVPGVSVSYGTVDNGDDDTDISELGFGLNLGVKYFVSDKWSLDARVGGLTYNSTTYDFDGEELTDSEFQFGWFGDNLNFGLTYYIGR